MVLLKQSFSFSGNGESLSSSQYDQNSVGNVEDGIRRVTIRQLLDASPTTSDRSMRFKINGSGIKKVMLVVNVLDNGGTIVSPTTTASRSYLFDDGSGRIRARSWETGGGYIFESFAYARVVGELDQYNGSKVFKVLNIQPIYDPHEIYFHILHTILDTLTVEKGPPPLDILSNTSRPDSNNQLDSVNLAFQQISLSGYNMVSPSSSSSASPIHPSSSSSADFAEVPMPAHPTEFSQVDWDVLECLSNPSLYQESGIHIEDIIANIKILHPTITSRQLCDSIEMLIAVRRVSTTIDDSHYQLIEN